MITCALCINFISSLRWMCTKNITALFCLMSDLKISVRNTGPVSKQNVNLAALFSFRVVSVSGVLTATLSDLSPPNLLNVTATALANWLTAVLQKVGPFSLP